MNATYSPTRPYAPSPKPAFFTPYAQQAPMRYMQHSAPAKQWVYDARSDVYYHWQPSPPPVPSMPYGDQLLDAGEGHSFAAIAKETLFVFLLLALAIGTAVGCVCLMGFDEQIIKMGEGLITWIQRLILS